jgi:hypothetical protein
MEVNSQIHSPAVLPMGKEPPVHIGMQVGWTPEPVWTLWSREKILSPTGNRTSTVQPIAIVTELSRLKRYRFQPIVGRCSVCFSACAPSVLPEVSVVCFGSWGTVPPYITSRILPPTLTSTLSDVEEKSLVFLPWNLRQLVSTKLSYPYTRQRCHNQ